METQQLPGNGNTALLPHFKFHFILLSSSC